jgi:signal transduction histidine kinase
VTSRPLASAASSTYRRTRRRALRSLRAGPARPTAALDDGPIAATRLILAAGALAVIRLVPSEPGRLVGLTYTLLGLYIAYAACVYAVLVVRPTLIHWLLDWCHWIDVAWYTALITLTSGTNSIFFFGFFFAILVASFRWGFASGMRVALASAILFTVFGCLTAPDPPEFEQRRFLIRPLYLLVLGYLVARWGGLEVMHRRRLEVLRELGAISSPRLGIDHVAGLVLHRIAGHFEAAEAAVLMEHASPPAMTLWRASAADPEGAASPREVPAAIARVLLAPPGGGIVAFHGEKLPREESERAAAVAEAFEAEAFAAVPLEWRGREIGRLYVLFRRPRTFARAEGEFLAEVAHHILPLLVHTQLLDQLAAEAARDERRRIALDLHDSVIQPYIGLGLGLTALRERLGPSEDAARQDVDRLLGMVDLGIDHLRGRVFTLRERDAPQTALGPAVQRFAARFAEITGIEVEVDAEPETRLPSRIVGEAFQMVAEGLSNVRRHTRALRAGLSVRREGDQVVLRIENEGTGERMAPFTPASISERATALGGRVRVDCRPDGGARVTVEIPVGAAAVPAGKAG